MKMEFRWKAILVSVVLIMTMGCPIPTSSMMSIEGTWQVIGTATSPPQYEGMIDSFQITLYNDGTGELVPGSGFDLGLDMSSFELLSGPNVTYTFNGQRASVLLRYSFRYQGAHFSSTHSFSLRVIEDGHLVGTRSVSVFQNGYFALGVQYDEDWTRLERAAEPVIHDVPKVSIDQDEASLVAVVLGLVPNG